MGAKDLDEWNAGRFAYQDLPPWLCQPLTHDPPRWDPVMRKKR